MKRFVFTAVLFLIAIAVVMAIVYRMIASKPVIVALVTYSSSGSVVGSSATNAGVLFSEETSGSRLAILDLDDNWEPSTTKRVISDARSKGVKFFITSHPSKCAVALLDQFADDDDALLLVTASTTDRLTGRDDGILRVVADVIQEQREIARHTAESKARDILVVQDTGNRPYTDPAFRIFSQALSNFGDCRISRQEIAVSDFHPENLEGFLAEDADLLYVIAGSYQPAIGTIAQLFHLKHPQASILLTPWTRSPAILEAAGPAADRIVLPTHYPSRHDNAAVYSYFERFKDRFGYEPISMSIGVRQSLELLNAAFRENRCTPREVKQYLLDNSPHTTSLGSIVFDRYGDVESTFYFMRDLRREFPE